MGWPATPELVQALSSNYPLLSRVDVYTGSTFKATIPVISWSVTATLNSQVTHTGTLVVTRDVIDEGLLNPLSDKVIIWSGIKDVEEIPLMTGRVLNYNRTNLGQVTVPISGFGYDIVAADFEVPWSSTPGLQTSLEMRAMIVDVDPTFTVDISRGPQDGVPVLTWEEDRGSALDDLATGTNSIWQEDRTGGFVLYPNPYAAPSTSTPVTTLTTGEGGNVAAAAVVTSREAVRNSVTVVVERTDNSEPIRVTVRDTDPLSPTFWGGPFGKQNEVVKSQNPISLSAAQDVATRRLRQLLAIARSWTLESSLGVLLDPGDSYILWWDDEVSQQVVESVTLNSNGLPQISGRELLFLPGTVV